MSVSLFILSRLLHCSLVNIFAMLCWRTGAVTCWVWCDTCQQLAQLLAECGVTTANSWRSYLLSVMWQLPTAGAVTCWVWCDNCQQLVQLLAECGVKTANSWIHFLGSCWLIDSFIHTHWVRPLTVSMHLGLMDRPFVPHNLNISPGDPCSFTKAPDGPPTWNLNILWFQKRNPNAFLFSNLYVVCLKSLVNGTRNKQNRRYKQINFIGLQNNRDPSQHTVGNVHKASGNCQQTPL
jgi:hypothetical protein